MTPNAVALAVVAFTGVVGALAGSALVGLAVGLAAVLVAALWPYRPY